MTQKFDLHKVITDKIVTAIEAGIEGGTKQLPWVGVRNGMPFNATTGREYRGVNVLLLWLEQGEKEYPTNEWASFKQWLDRGHPVCKGEKGTTICFYKGVKAVDENGNEDRENSYRFMRYSKVFNASQVEGWESPTVEYPDLAERIQAAEDFVINCSADIRYGYGGACYVPSKDQIHMPAWKAFRDTQGGTATEHAYGVLLHELTHWTGHKHRCARDEGMKGRFGTAAYAMEELVAELGASFLCATLGIEKEPRQDHAKYIESWLKVLKKDSRAIFTAASKASLAVDFLEGLQYDDGEPGQSPGLPALPAPVASEPVVEPVVEPEAEKAKPIRSIKVGGVTITPRWPWSKDYRSHVQAQARALAKDNTEDLVQRRKRVAIEYARWLAHRDGMSGAIEHATATPDLDKESGRYRSVTFTTGLIQVVINIPNHDWDPNAAKAA